jgi:Ca2+-binding EF-hand superfamily protein
MNRHKNLLTISVIALCLATTPLFAQDKNTPSPAQISQLQAQLTQRFVKADVNKDGKLTKEEAKGKMPRVYDNFEKIDSAKKGYVTQKQIEDFAMTMIAQRQ